MSSTTADVDVIHEADDVARELTRLAVKCRREGFPSYGNAIDALAGRLNRALDAQERGHRVPPSDAGQRILDLLGEQGDCHPTPAHLVDLALEAGIVVNSVAARDLIDFLWSSGWIESFAVDDITFVALEGKRPALEDLPKAGDEIVLVSEGAVTP